MFRSLGTLVFLLLAAAANAAPLSIASARVWPGADYTRITFESAKPVAHTMTVLNNPDRVVLDLENVELNATLKSLADKVQGGDLYIKNVRAANFKPGIVRLVIDLKAEVKPSLFALKPAGEYKHRLVLDIYPKQDPLMAMLDQHTKGQDESTGGGSPDMALMPQVEPVPADVYAANQAEKPAEAITQGEIPKEQVAPKDGVDRLITVAIDAGHGGEDSGARGASGTNEKM